MLHFFLFLKHSQVPRRNTSFLNRRYVLQVSKYLGTITSKVRRYVHFNILGKNMTSYGKAETEKLKQNLENQLDRLVEQLQDLESCRDELDSEEYEETKEDTMDQLKELNSTLTKLVNGDISLINSLGAMQLATQAAISQAFKTPEVIRLFGRREPKQLRERLKNVELDFKLNRLSPEANDRQKAEILIALRQLGEQLTPAELQFLEKHNDISNAFKNIEFVEVEDVS